MLMGISVLGLALALRGRFFPIGGLLLFSPLPLTALLFLYLGRADSSRLVNKSVNDRSHLLIMVLDIRMKRHHLDQGDL
jgi:hypothetical protein